MDNQSLIQKVQHLQARLGHTQDSRKISKALKSLQELDLTLEILVGTGVGKTVNGLRKHTEVGDFAKSIVHEWKKLVPEVTENDHKSVTKHEPKETLQSKQVLSKPKHKEDVMEKLNSENDDHWNEELPESQTHAHKNTHNKTKYIKVYEKKSDSKEMKPKKVPQGKDYESEISYSKGDKSKSFQFSEKKTEKSSHSSNNEKNKVNTKKSERSHQQSRHDKNNVGHSSCQQSVENKAETLSSEEFEAPAMSFESYLNYDQVSNKRKKKLYLTNEPPKKVQVCKQYCNMKQSHSEEQTTNLKKEEENNEMDTKKRCFEDLLSIPLPKILPDYDFLPSPPSDEAKGNIPDPVIEISPETSGFTGKRLNSKMLVYSGSKTIYLPKMLSLYQQCIRVLQNNIDSIQEVGGVPFEILQPVLERCTPEQLNRIEEYNPDFMEDSDHLWKKHCGRDFKGHQLLEYESWREMYLRVFSAREEKLKMITQNISSTYSGKPKGRQVKLAYIHGAAKPPRYIRRKQEINGTAGPIVQPHPIEKIKLQKQEKQESKESSISNSNVPVSNNQHGGPSQDTKKIVKKIAPMMAKSMRAFKNRVGPR